MIAFAPFKHGNSLAGVGLLVICLLLIPGMACARSPDRGSQNPGMSQEFSSPIEAIEHFYTKEGTPASPSILGSSSPTTIELIANSYADRCIEHFGPIAVDSTRSLDQRIKAAEIVSLIRTEGQLKRVYDLLKRCSEDSNDTLARLAIRRLSILPLAGVSKVVTAHLSRLVPDIGHRMNVLATTIEVGDSDLLRFLDQNLGPAATLPARSEFATREPEAISIQDEVRRAGIADSGFLLFCYQLKCSLQTIASSDAKDKIRGLIEGYPAYKAFFESHAYPLWGFIREIQICAVRSRNRELMEPLLAFKNRAMKEYSQWYERKGRPFALKSILTEAEDSPAIYASDLRQLLVSLRLLGFPLSPEEEQVLTEMGIIGEPRLLLRSRGIVIKQEN
jgi:hypothetical protein